MFFIFLQFLTYLTVYPTLLYTFRLHNILSHSYFHYIMHVCRCLPLLLQLLSYFFTLITVNIGVYIYSDIFIIHKTINLISTFSNIFAISLCVTNIVICINNNNSNIIVCSVIIINNCWLITICIRRSLCVVSSVTIVTNNNIIASTNNYTMTTTNVVCQIHVCLVDMFSVIINMYVRQLCVMFSFNRHYILPIILNIVNIIITIIVVNTKFIDHIFSIIIIVMMLVMCNYNLHIRVITYCTLWWRCELRCWCNELRKTITVRWVVN